MLTDELGFTDAAPSYKWTEYGIPIRNIWYMLLYAWEELPQNRLGVLDDVEDAPTLDSLLASILIKLVQQRMRIGLGRSYSVEESLLRGIRGRIDFTDSLTHHTFEHGQVYCNFEQYTLNVPKNQIIRSTLARLIQTGNFGTEIDEANKLRHKLRWLTRAMESIDLMELKLDFIRRQQLGRNDRDYRLMIAICELILERQMPADSIGNTRRPAIDQASLVMFHIYERFIARFYRTHLKGWKIKLQSPLNWPAENPNSFLPMMKPDLILENQSSGRIIILDTKFTANGLITNQWGNKVFNSSHLYQVYAYLKTQEHLSQEFRHASGILLYPMINQSRLSEKITLLDQSIRIETIDLTSQWQDIERGLLDIIAAD